MLDDGGLRSPGLLALQLTRPLEIGETSSSLAPLRMQRSVPSVFVETTPLPPIVSVEGPRAHGNLNACGGLRHCGDRDLGAIVLADEGKAHRVVLGRRLVVHVPDIILYLRSIWPQRSLRSLALRLLSTAFYLESGSMALQGFGGSGSPRGSLLFSCLSSAIFLLSNNPNP